MTLTSQIITDAFRQSNLLALGTTPTAAQSTEALRYLNRIVKSVFGAEAGEPFQAFPLGTNNIDRPAGYPWWGNSPPADWFIPKNQRLMLNLTEGATVYLHPKPDDGSRFAVMDVSDNLATNNLVIDGNGRSVEGSSSVTLNTNGLEREWFYRQDLGDWVRYSALEEADTFPFPEEFDDMFISMLAMRLNPAYGASMDPQSIEVLNRAKRQFKARYHQTVEVKSEEALIRTLGIGYLWDYGYENETEFFDRGIPW